MGANTCQYGTVHKMCRCRTPHSITCPTPSECQADGYEPKHKAWPPENLEQKTPNVETK